MNKLNHFEITVLDKTISLYKDKYNKVWVSETVVCGLFNIPSFSEFQDRLKYAGGFIVQEIVYKKFELEDGEKQFFIDLKTLDFAFKVLEVSQEGRVVHEAINDWLLENDSDYFLSDIHRSNSGSRLTSFECAINLCEKFEKDTHLYDQPFNIELSNIDEFFVFRVISNLRSELGLRLPRFKKTNNSSSRKELNDYCRLVTTSFNDANKFLNREASFEERIANVFYTTLKTRFFDYCDEEIKVAVVLSIMESFYSCPPFSCAVDDLISNEQLAVALGMVNCSVEKTPMLLQKLSLCFKPSGLCALAAPMTEKELQSSVRTNNNRGNVIKSIVAFIENYSTIYHHSDYYTISYHKSHMGASCTRYRLNVGASLERQDTLVFDYIISPFIENELQHHLLAMTDNIIHLVSGWMKKDLSCIVRNSVNYYYSMKDLKLEFRPHLSTNDYLD